MDSKEVPAEELGRHREKRDAWIAVNGIIWDVSGFAELHPGGEDIILECLGTDASAIYNGIHGPGLIAKHLGEEKRIGKLICQHEKNTNSAATKALGTIDRPPLGSILNLGDFEEIARQTFSEKAWAYVSGAANDCSTVAMNREWYSKIFFRPRVLKDVSNCDMSCTIFGARFDSPIFNAPASLVMMAHPEGEVAIAKASVAAGGTVMIPMMSSYPVDEIIEVLPPEHPWFYQLYLHPDRQRNLKILETVRALKPTAIVITVDLPSFPKREANERYEIKVSSAKTDRGPKQARSVSRSISSSLIWEDIVWIKETAQSPVVLKGIQTAADAKLAYESGCAGIYISNHGGRALDGAQPSILTLLEIQANCPEVLEKMEVFIDGGIRRGSDILKAICLGASAVCLGRPIFYSAGYGVAGVEHAFRLLKDELQVAMELAGITSLNEAHPGLLNTGLIDQYIHRSGENDSHPWAKKIVRSRL